MIARLRSAASEPSVLIPLRGMLQTTTTLTVSSTGLTNLNGLRSLQTVGGTAVIDSNTKVGTFSIVRWRACRLLADGGLSDCWPGQLTSLVLYKLRTTAGLTISNHVLCPIVDMPSLSERHRPSCFDCC